MSWIAWSRLRPAAARVVATRQITRESEEARTREREGEWGAGGEREREGKRETESEKERTPTSHASRQAGTGSSVTAAGLIMPSSSRLTREI